MRFEKLEFVGHKILKVDLLSGGDAIEQALEQSSLKAEKVHKGSPSGRQRSKAEITSQNFLGGLADIVCARLMTGYFKKHGIGLQVIRYDDVRDDDFQHPDLYDIMIKSADVESLVEIRSSACVYLSLESMVKKWQVLGPYASLVKGEAETEKSFYLRPIYHLASYESNRKTKIYDKTSSIDLVKGGELDLYFVGGATHELLQRKGRDEKGVELKQGSSSFKVIDILDGYDAKDILEEMGRLG